MRIHNVVLAVLLITSAFTVSACSDGESAANPDLDGDQTEADHDANPDDGDIDLPDGDVDDTDGDIDENDGDADDTDGDEDETDGDADEVDGDSPPQDCVPGSVCCTDDGEFAQAGTACTDDALDCTEDVCAADGLCKHNLIDGRCLIGDSCYQHNQSDPKQPCQYCDTAIAKTEWTARPLNTACDDGLYCNGPNDACNDVGVCVHPGNPCPETECNSCQEDTDSCFDPAGTACGDATDNTCNGADTCDGAGTCSPNIADNGTACDVNGVACIEDSCRAGFCMAGRPSDTYCDQDSDALTHDACDTAYDCYAKGWALTFGSTQDDKATNITPLADGGFAVVGEFAGAMDLTPGQEGGELSVELFDDMFMAVYNADGSLRFVKHFEGEREETAASIVQLENGSLAVAGHFSGELDVNPGATGGEHSSNGGYDIFVAVFQLDGTYRYSKSFGTAYGDYVYDITSLADGGMAVAGLYSGAIDFNPGASGGEHDSNDTRDAFVVLYNEDGSYRTSKSIGAAGTDHAEDVIQLNDGGLAVTGVFGETVDFNPDAPGGDHTADGTLNIFLVIYNADGSYRFSQRFGTDGKFVLENMVKLENGNIAIAGIYRSEIDFDPEQNGSGEHSIDEPTLFSGFVAVFAPDGTYQWSRGVDATKVGQANAVVALSDGGLTIIGSFVGDIDFDPDVAGQGEFTSYSEGTGYDMFQATFNADGSYRYAETHVCGAGNLFTCIIQVADRGLIAAGRFGFTEELDWGEGTDQRTSNDESNDVIIQRFNPRPACSSSETSPCNGAGKCETSDAGFTYCLCRNGVSGYQCEVGPE